jgi:hypothetical protein
MDAVFETKVIQYLFGPFDLPFVEHSILDCIKAVNRKFYCFYIDSSVMFQVSFQGIKVAVNSDLIYFASYFIQLKKPPCKDMYGYQRKAEQLLWWIRRLRSLIHPTIFGCQRKFVG